MEHRQEHQQQVRGFLQEHLAANDWVFSLPEGTGLETYFAREGDREYFVKLGAPVERYLVLAELGLTPPVLAYGQLDNGESILIQPRVSGRKPSQKDYWERLDRVAAIVHKLHHDPGARHVLPLASSDSYEEAGLRAIQHLVQKWEQYRTQLTGAADFVDASLERLAQQIRLFSGGGLIAAHNDICNANWLFADTGDIYLLDFDAMSLDDPASDLGPLLWWYYPAELRGRFLEIAGYENDHELRLRMQVRRSMHLLHITLPREGSFDRFYADEYVEGLQDFEASLECQENPRGYAGW